MAANSSKRLFKVVRATPSRSMLREVSSGMNCTAAPNAGNGSLRHRHSANGSSIRAPRGVVNAYLSGRRRVNNFRQSSPTNFRSNTLQCYPLRVRKFEVAEKSVFPSAMGDACLTGSAIGTGGDATRLGVPMGRWVFAGPRCAFGHEQFHHQQDDPGPDTHVGHVEVR